MSGYYVRQDGVGLGSSYMLRQAGIGLGLSIRDIPVIGSILNSADAKFRQAVEYIVQKYAEFQKVGIEAPGQVAEARKVLSVLQSTDSSAQQLAQAQQYLEKALAAQKASENRGPVDQVVAWIRSVSGTQLGAIPLIPLAIVATAGTAAYIVSTAIKSGNEARTVRAALQAGLSPEQIAKLGVGGMGGITTGILGATSAITVVALGVGALFLIRAVQGK